MDQWTAPGPRARASHSSRAPFPREAAAAQGASFEGTPPALPAACPQPALLSTFAAHTDAHASRGGQPFNGSHASSRRAAQWCCRCELELGTRREICTRAPRGVEGAGEGGRACVGCGARARYPPLGSPRLWRWNWTRAGGVHYFLGARRALLSCAQHAPRGGAGMYMSFIVPYEEFVVRA